MSKQLYYVRRYGRSYVNQDLSADGVPLMWDDHLEMTLEQLRVLRSVTNRWYPVNLTLCKARKIAKEVTTRVLKFGQSTPGMFEYRVLPMDEYAEDYARKNLR